MFSNKKGLEWMILKEKNLDVKEKFLYLKKNIWGNVQVFNGYLYKILARYFCIIFCFRTFKAFLFILRKKASILERRPLRILFFRAPLSEHSKLFFL